MSSLTLHTRAIIICLNKLSSSNFRKRTAGTNVLTLACGKKVAKTDEFMVNDPFKLNFGGLVDMKNMKGTGTRLLASITCKVIDRLFFKFKV